jgi:hypothetical protein
MIVILRKAFLDLVDNNSHEEKYAKTCSIGSSKYYNSYYVNSYKDGVLWFSYSYLALNYKQIG